MIAYAIEAARGCGLFARVLSEFDKIPRYAAEGFLEEIGGCAAYPQLPFGAPCIGVAAALAAEFRGFGS
eukprot:gene29757-33593_t